MVNTQNQRDIVIINIKIGDENRIIRSKLLVAADGSNRQFVKLRELKLKAGNIGNHVL